MSMRGLCLTGLAAFGSMLIAGSLSVVAAADAEGCPNEALRTELGSGFLPDCRAYEMVSPPYKEGYTILVRSYAPDGNKVLLYSLGDLAGAAGGGESAIEGDVYLAVRTANGWQLSSLNPSESEFVGQVPVAYEAADGETLWKQHTPSQSEPTRDLYVRSATGVFSLIGPLGLPTPTEEEPSNAINTFEVSFDTPVAATSDYKHVLVYAKFTDGYWPFDETAGKAGSVYEYSGTGNGQPILVGVEGPKKSRKLIGLCGTEPGSGPAGSEYNSLSADGEVVFFTVAPQGRFGCTAAPAPAVAEVYARLHGALDSPEAAETVDVSASECSEVCGGESGKNFEGASESGEKVFFTSTQKLTNNAVDGTASGDAEKGEGCAGMSIGSGSPGCNLYVYDFGAPVGAHLRLVAGGGVQGVGGVAEDGTRVYFVSQSAIATSSLNEFGVGPVAEQPNLYAYDTVTEKTAFVATLSDEDHQDWQREFRRPVEVAGGEGQFLLFASSTADLIPGDKTGLTQLFEYDAESKELVRLTQGEDGYNEDGNGVASGVEPVSIESVVEPLGRNRDFKSTTNRLNISADGRTVIFVTRGALSPRALSAAQGCRSVYEFHTNGKLSEGRVSLLSDGRDTQLFKSASACGPLFQGIDASGANVLFSTADPLVPSDVDGVQRDVYDAREGGGLPPVVPVPVCEGEACQGAVSSPPQLGAPASTGGSGEGNLIPPLPLTTMPVSPKKAAVRCVKGKRLSHGRCVRVKSKKKITRAKSANRGRRMK